MERALEWAKGSALGVAEWLELPDLYPQILPVFLRQAEGVTTQMPHTREQWRKARGRMKRGYEALPFSQEMKDAYAASLDEAEADRRKGESH